MYEGDGLAAVGSALGVALAVPYAGYLLKVLVSLWPDPSVGTFLTLHVNPLSLVIGWALGLFTALLAMFLALRSLVKVPPPQLLRGTTAVVEPVTVKSRWPVVTAVALAILAVGLLARRRFLDEPGREGRVLLRRRGASPHRRDAARPRLVAGPAGKGCQRRLRVGDSQCDAEPGPESVSPSRSSRVRRSCSRPWRVSAGPRPRGLEGLLAPRGIGRAVVPVVR